MNLKPMLHENMQSRFFSHAVNYFNVSSFKKKQPTNLANDRQVDKTEGHETVMGEYYLNKESRQDLTVFSLTVSTSIDAIWPGKLQKISFQDMQ